ncbi:MAG TPA: sensor domain-containing diguanylate cyclase [Kofleriaceae bacterium]|nr:sensor domain-containing diguanylate cyclase [Kofleriaceae bacterium]
MASPTPSQPRLLSIIDLQNAIAAAALNGDEVMQLVADRARMLLSAGTALVALIEGDDFVCRAVVGSDGMPAVGARLPRAQSLAGRCVAEGRALRSEPAPAATLPDGEQLSRDPASLTGHCTACVPLIYGESAVGVLEVASTRPAAFDDEDVETLRLLGQIIAIALHRAYTYPRPRYDNTQDALTGLGNRRAFEERLEAELNRNRRFHHSFSLALVKLSGLEAASDRLGQAAGDDMLRKVALILKQHTRMIDGCFRTLADELAIVMPGTAREGATIVTDRCRETALDAKACDPAVKLGFGVVAAVAGEVADEILARAHAVLGDDLKA